MAGVPAADRQALAAVPQAAPAAGGILADQPPGCWRARPFLERQGVADRCALHPGDLFAPHRRPTCTCWPACCTTGTTTTRPAS